MSKSVFLRFYKTKILVTRLGRLSGSILFFKFILNYIFYVLRAIKRVIDLFTMSQIYILFLSYHYLFNKNKQGNLIL